MMQLEKNSLKGEIKMDNEKMFKEALEQGIEYYKKAEFLFGTMNLTAINSIWISGFSTVP